MQVNIKSNIMGIIQQPVLFKSCNLAILKRIFVIIIGMLIQIKSSAADNCAENKSGASLYSETVQATENIIINAIPKYIFLNK